MQNRMKTRVQDQLRRKPMRVQDLTYRMQNRLPKTLLRSSKFHSW
jgi:hypothetical protein